MSKIVESFEYLENLSTKVFEYLKRSNVSKNKIYPRIK